MKTLYEICFKFIRECWDDYCSRFTVYYWDYPYDIQQPNFDKKEIKENEKGDA